MDILKKRSVKMYGGIGLGVVVALVLISGAFMAGRHSSDTISRSMKGGDRMMMNHRMQGETGMRMNMEVSGNRMMMDNDMTLTGKTGDEFDKAFLSTMITHHASAITMANQVLTTSKRPELIQLANEIIAAQTKEINTMKSWYTQWFIATTTTP